MICSEEKKRKVTVLCCRLYTLENRTRMVVSQTDIISFQQRKGISTGDQTTEIVLSRGTNYLLFDEAEQGQTAFLKWLILVQGNIV